MASTSASKMCSRWPERRTISIVETAPQIFDLAPLCLTVEATLTRRQCRPGSAASLWYQRSSIDQLLQSFDGIGAILLQAAKALRLDDDAAVLADIVMAHRQQSGF